MEERIRADAYSTEVWLEIVARVPHRIEGSRGKVASPLDALRAVSHAFRELVATDPRSKLIAGFSNGGTLSRRLVNDWTLIALFDSRTWHSRMPQTLDLSECTEITTSVLGKIPYSVWTLNLRGCPQIVPGDLRELPMSVQELDVSDWALTGHLIESVPPTLYELKLGGRLTEGVFARLSPALTVLDLSSCQLDVKSFASLPVQWRTDDAVSCTRIVRLRNHKLTPEILCSVDQYIRPATLDCSYATFVDGAGILGHRRKIKLSGVTSFGDPLWEMPSANAIDLSGALIDVGLLKRLGNQVFYCCTSHLSLCDWSLDTKVIEAIPRSIGSLSLSRSRLSKPSVRLLKQRIRNGSIECLWGLGLVDCDCVDDLLEGELPHLTRLRLSAGALNRGISFKNLGSLEHLKIVGVGVQPTSIAAIPKHISKVTLERGPVAESSLRALPKSITELTLHRCPLSAVLIQAIPTSVSRLWLSRCFINTEVARAFSQKDALLVHIPDSICEHALTEAVNGGQPHRVIPAGTHMENLYSSVCQIKIYEHGQTRIEPEVVPSAFRFSDEMLTSETDSDEGEDSWESSSDNGSWTSSSESEDESICVVF